MEILKRLVTEEEGAGMVEYGLLIALIAVIAVTGLIAFGNSINTFFGKIGTWLDGGNAPIIKGK